MVFRLLGPSQLNCVQVLWKRVAANVRGPFGALFHSKLPPITAARLLAWRPLGVRRPNRQPAAPIAARLIAPSQNSAIRDGGNATKSLSQNELRPIIGSSGILPTSAVFVPKERAGWQLPSWFVASGPRSTAGNPRKDKTLKSPPIGGSPNSRAEPKIS